MLRQHLSRSSCNRNHLRIEGQVEDLDCRIPCPTVVVDSVSQYLRSQVVQGKVTKIQAAFQITLSSSRTTSNTQQTLSLRSERITLRGRWRRQIERQVTLRNTALRMKALMSKWRMSLSRRSRMNNTSQLLRPSREHLSYLHNNR